jgi:RNA polymerase sigma-70 factor (ECF subfamily)
MSLVNGRGPVGDDGPDAGWIEQVRAVYDRVSGQMWRALVASSGSTHVADDAVAEGFTQLLRRGPEVRDPAAWVWRASFRLAAGDLQRRRQAADRQVVGSHADDATSAIAGPVDRLPDDAIDLVRALARLTDQQRRCVALVDIAGHTAPSAAAILGTSAATVRVQLMRARRHLRVLLSEDDRPPDPTSTTGPRPGRSRADRRTATYVEESR